MADEPLSHKDIEKEVKAQSTVTDLIDMYDEDIARLGSIWTSVQMQFSRKANTRDNLDELEKRVVDECLKIGLVVRVHTGECLLGIGPVTIEPIGRMADAHDGFFDHEKKRQEVIASKELGEDFRGQKEKL